MGAVGTATLDFGATPAEETTVTVAGQAGFVATSAVEAWVQHGDSTADNGVDEHEEMAALCPLVRETHGDLQTLRARMNAARQRRSQARSAAT